MISSQIHIALVFLAVFVAISCASVYKTPAGVAPLHVSREQFNHATTNRGDPRVWIVLFHSTFCGSCQQFHSTWSEFAEHFSSKGVTDIFFALHITVVCDKICIPSICVI